MRLDASDSQSGTDGVEESWRDFSQNGKAEGAGFHY